jgi:hypothetical protein
VAREKNAINNMIPLRGMARDSGVAVFNILFNFSFVQILPFFLQFKVPGYSAEGI